jgi:hypothetical protein
MNDPNHDIVPSLRMLDGFLMGQAADEIEMLRSAATQTDELILSLQRALAYWMPSIAGVEHPFGEKAAEHAMLLYGLSDDIPDGAGDHMLNSLLGLTRLMRALLEALRAAGCPDGVYPVHWLADNPQRDAAERDAAAECLRQDEQWGGPAHDDQHFTSDFVRFIRKQVTSVEIDFGKTDADVRSRFVKIAALGMATVRFLDRKAAAKNGAVT